MMMTDRKKRGRPRNPEADRAILMQTLRLLAEQGYAGMSIEGVAAAAGVGKATLYRRYKDKHDLIVAALSLLVGEAPLLPDTGAVELDLLTGATDFLRYFNGMNLFSLIGALLVQAQQHPEFLDLFRKHVILPRRAAIKGLLERGVERDQLRRDVELEVVVDCIAGSIFARHLSGLPMDERWIQSMIRIVLGGAASETCARINEGHRR